MQDKLQKILSESKFFPSNKDLEVFLLVRLQKRIRLINQIKFISYLTVSVVSVSVLFVVVKSLYNDLNNSGVYNYFHLIVSEDLSTLASFSKELIYTLVESLPVMSMTLSFGILFVFMFSFNGVLLSLRKSLLFKN